MTPIYRRNCEKGFFHKLTDRVKETNSLLCVGIDPHEADLGAATAVAPPAAAYSATNTAAAATHALVAYSQNIIKQTQQYACCFKPNVAFFEAFGSHGIAALECVCASIPAEIPILLDAKRGDIGSTAQAYASAAFSIFQADAVTVNPYLGRDSVEPFLAFQNRGVFILVKTSNESSRDFQELSVANDHDATTSPLYTHVASLCEKVAHELVDHEPHTCEVAAGSCSGQNKAGGGVGLVVGATDTEALRKVRKICQDLWILAPGVGFQGGSIKDTLSAGLRQDGMGVIIPVSRGISRAKDMAAEAAALRQRINEARAEVLLQGPDATPC